MLLTLDMGASRSKWALFEGDQERASGTAPPLPGHLYTPEARQGLADIMANLQAAVPGQVTSIVAGVSGLQTELAPLLADVLAGAFGLSPAAIYVTDDLHLAYAAQFADGEGTLVYAGTGSMAYHRTAAGAVIRAGGHGFLIDDAGGAFWQGRQGLKTVLRQANEGQVPGLLADAIFGVIGSAHWPDIRAYVYGEGRAAVARLAPAVYGAALEGDADALGIQRRAGEELARLGQAALQRGGGDIATAGGAFNPLVWQTFRAQFDSAKQIRAGVSPLLGGHRLAQRLNLTAPELRQAGGFV